MQTAAIEIINKINDQIINPLIVLLFGFALVIFLWGGFKFIYGADSADGREKGTQHMIWGIVGMVIMLSVFGILRIAAGTFGIDLPS